MVLQRIIDNGIATVGVLVLGDWPWLTTLEPPWRGNKRNESCIPAGVYQCAAFESIRFGKTYRVVDVPGRAGILFHAGNTVLDTSGCILLGRAFNRKGVAESKLAMRDFLTFLQGPQDFTLHVKPPSPAPDPRDAEEVGLAGARQVLR
jgi:hypothetical protein